MRDTTTTRRLLVATAAAALLGASLAAPPPAAAQASDDTSLFTVAVPPNVLLLVDNSGSMNHIVWHPDFDPNATYSCNPGTGGWTTEQFWASNETRSRCGTTRTFYYDPETVAAGNYTRFDPRYLNWIHSLPNGDPRLAEIAALNNGTYSPCLQARGYSTFHKYRRARVTAAKDVLREVICNVNEAGEVRFGLAHFRRPGGSNDPNGGFVRVPVNDFDAPTYTLNGFTGTHLQHLERAIEAFEGDSWTPLGESLFQLYTYFMSRKSSDLPTGRNGSKFPLYTYRTNNSGNYGSYSSNSKDWAPDPVQYDCQKHFVIIITDGEPTKDDFDTNANTGDNTNNGFGSFTGLIGDYHNDGEVEIGGAACVGGDECALYLDDIAKYMHDHDFRPDRDGMQTLDVYTVGFTTSPAANDLLSRTASLANGQFFFSNSAEELATAITSAVTDILQKAQAFTAATVPATRTAEGGNFYTSLFVPNDTPYWEGHLKLFQITSTGDILDKQGNCALLDPSPPGECKSGAVAPSAPAFWDARDEIPAPASRDLYTSLPGTGRVAFDTSLSYTALGDPSDPGDDLTLADLGLYAGSNAATVEQLADTIIQSVRGCKFGTGVNNACEQRPWLLGDIFHSNPLIVGNPRGFTTDASYAAFRSTYGTRDKMIFAGANDGFLHAFHAGSWNASATPPGYDRGTGKEVFGFMPWPARRNIRHLPIDTGGRDYYFVDGSPAAADVWFYSSPTQTTKAANGSEWRTVLAGGLRQGGNAYYALDVTDPASPNYPRYLWEFPAEDAPASLHQYMGQTWGRPIFTRVRVELGGVPYERWVAVVSAGYDPSGDPNSLSYDPNATAGRAIFILDAKTGEILGEKRFSPSAGDERSEMRYAIAATPSVFDLNGDGYADVIYVGDLGGNLWKWVIAYEPLRGNFGVDAVNGPGSTDQPNWTFRRIFRAAPTMADPLGVTIGTTTYYKSIFFSPAGTLRNGRLWLAFGTGERADLQRKGVGSTTAENNRFYSIQDPDPLERSATPQPTITESMLYDATLDATCANLAGYRGYYLRADDSEKFVTDVELFAYYVITSSFTPSSTVDPCSGGGSARLYLFRVHCGEGFFDDGSGNPTRTLELGSGMPTDPKISVSPDGTRVIVSQQEGEIENWDGPIGAGNAPGQLYWREVNTQ